MICALNHSRYKQDKELTLFIEPVTNTIVQQDSSKKLEQPQQVNKVVTNSQIKQPPKRVEKQETTEKSSLQSKTIKTEQKKTTQNPTPEKVKNSNTSNDKTIKKVEIKSSTLNYQQKYDALIKYLDEKGKTLKNDERDKYLLQLEHLREKLKMTKAQVVQDVGDKLNIKSRQIERLLFSLPFDHKINNIDQKLEQKIQALVKTKVKEHPIGKDMLSSYVNINHSYNEIILIAEKNDMMFCIDESISKLIQELMNLIEKRDKKSSNSIGHEYLEKISKNFPFSKKMEEKLIQIYSISYKRKHIDSSFSGKKVKKESIQGDSDLTGYTIPKKK